MGIREFVIPLPIFVCGRVLQSVISICVSLVTRGAIYISITSLTYAFYSGIHAIAFGNSVLLFAVATDWIGGLSHPLAM